MMKINPFLLIISLVISALIFYGFYQWYDSILYSIGSALVSFVFLATSMAISSGTAERSSMMSKVLSGTFFTVFLVINILFAVFNVSNTWFIMVNGLGLCLWSTTIYGIAKANQ